MNSYRNIVICDCKKCSASFEPVYPSIKRDFILVRASNKVIGNDYNCVNRKH